MKKSALLLASFLTACGGQSIPQKVGNLFNSGSTNGIPAPNVGQWDCYHCVGVSPDGTGSFNFPNSGGAVGYIYTGSTGNPIGKTLSISYTISGTGTIVPSPASGSGAAQLRPFLWRKGDDVTCSNTTEWYRWWSKAAGPLTVGQHTVTTSITYDQWTDCYAKQDQNQFAGTTSNLVGIGFTFGAEFFGHGVYSNGQNHFQLNSFGVR